MSEIFDAAADASLPLVWVKKILGEESFRLTEMRVLAHLLGCLDRKAYTAVSVVEIAAAVGGDRSRVSVSMARLRKAGVVERGPKIGRSHTYRLAL